MVRASDARFRAMFDCADIVSEGSARREGAMTVWYGTTSLALSWPAELSSRSQRPGPAYATGAARAFLVEVAGRDLHVRLRAVRVAYREASVRAPGSLGRASCELRIAAGEDGLRIDVDVQAPLTLPSQRALRPPP